jgi:parvulin-like peptidyl-prolyl isomerase
VPEATIRWIVESGLYRRKVQDAILAELDLPKEEDQVWARHILVADETAANDLYQQLLNGANFAELASQNSIDTGSAANGGDLGWFGAGKMVQEFESAAFALQVGEISQPVKSSNGWHIIQSLGHEVRKLNESEYNQLEQEKFNEWLQNQRAATTVEIDELWREVTPLITLPTAQ